MAILASAAAEACSLCGDPRARSLFEKDGIPYRRCASCGFVFSRPPRNANLESALEDYEPAYLAYLDETPEDAWNFDALLGWIERQRPLAGARVLDVGSGSGKLVHHLRRGEIEACGLEPSEALYRRFLADSPHFARDTLEGFAARSPAGVFDVVIACDVIEHVERPDRFLAAASRLLAPEGWLFVATPDVESWLARIAGRRWHYFNKYHLSYLSRRTLGSLAARSGLRERSFRRLWRRKSLGYLLQYLLDFGWGGGPRRVPERLHRVAFPVNLFDTLYASFEKAGGEGAAPREVRRHQSS